MTSELKKIADHLYGQRDELSRQLQALSHPDRLGIVALVLDGEKPFGYLQSQLGTSKTALANHLHTLVAERLVTKEERGVYDATDRARMLLESLSEFLKRRRKQRLELLRREHLQSLEKYEVKVMKVETNTVKHDIEFRPSWITYAGAVCGVLQAFGESYDVADILGYSGYAFLSNVSRRSTHIAAPTATPFFRQFDQGVSSLGYPFKGFWDEGAVFGRQGLSKDDITRLNRLFKFVRDQLDHGNPVILWGLGAAEFGIVKGYSGEKLEVSTFRSHVPDLDDHPLHYTELDAPGGLWAYHFQRKETEPGEATDREAVERALLVTEGGSESTTVGTPEGEWVEEELDFVSGPRAFGLWARNIEQGEIDQRGNAYVIACYHEARDAASTFFGRLASRYRDRPFSEELTGLTGLYRRTAEMLRGLHQSFPFPAGSLDQEALAEAPGVLRSIQDLEFEAVDMLQKCLEKWEIQV